MLGPDLLCVHGVHLTEADRRALAASRAPLCVCPRSNLHIGGQLPDVPALLAAGLPLCIGTDGLGSCPDLDVLGEISVLLEAFPEVPAGVWLEMATRGGADALRHPHHGRLQLGAAPGLLLLEGVGDPGELGVVPDRRWLVPPPSTSGGPHG